uniref:Uncharacterized protein n=1 Tax=Ditylenchus dipsaci TaxID=166011 RepID=A0A915E5E6_9BILA
MAATVLLKISRLEQIGRKRAPYMTSGYKFIDYDDNKSLLINSVWPTCMQKLGGIALHGMKKICFRLCEEQKEEFQQLAGIALSTLHQDDYSNKCGNKAFPLLQAVTKATKCNKPAAPIAIKTKEMQPTNNQCPLTTLHCNHWSITTVSIQMAASDVRTAVLLLLSLVLVLAQQKPGNSVTKRAADRLISRQGVDDNYQEEHNYKPRTANKFKQGRCSHYCFFVPLKDEKINFHPYISINCSHLVYGFATINPQNGLDPVTSFDMLYSDSFANYRQPSPTGILCTQTVRRDTINVHKRIHGIGFKLRAQRAIDEVRKFAE